MRWVVSHASRPPHACLDVDSALSRGYKEPMVVLRLFLHVSPVRRDRYVLRTARAAVVFLRLFFGNRGSRRNEDSELCVLIVMRSRPKRQRQRPTPQGSVRGCNLNSASQYTPQSPPKSHRRMCAFVSSISAEQAWYVRAPTSKSIRNKPWTIVAARSRHCLRLTSAGDCRA